MSGSKEIDASVPDGHPSADGDHDPEPSTGVPTSGDKSESLLALVCMHVSCSK